MTEYIDLDTPLEVKVAYDNTYKPYTSTLRELLDVNHIPYTAADVRPVKRGKWIQTTQPMGWRDEDCAECSVCGEDFVLDEWAMDEFTNLMNFCPNCGADMREES